MAYLNRDVAGGGGGGRGRFGPGMSNPSFGGPSTTPMPDPRRPSGRAQPNQPFDYQLFGRMSAMDKPWMGNWAGGDTQKSVTGPQNRRNMPGTLGGQGRISDMKTPAWLRELREKAGAREGFNEPGIPDFQEWEGEKWAPSRTYDEQAIDTGELISATDALINEELGTTMSEAARRYGSAGALMSGGGIGGGFSGTLAESERGAMRDRAEMRHRYRFQGEQAEAERRARALEGEMGREFAGYEGGQSRGLRQSESRNRYNWDRYGAELGVSGREEDDFQREIDMMMSLYGM